MPAKATQTLVQSGDLPVELRRIIRPEAQARWILPSLAQLTPQYIETILRGALVGNHVFQWQLFDMMEDTWPRLVKNLNELKSAAIVELQDNWRIQAWNVKGEDVKAESEERAALCQEALLKMPSNPALNENGFTDTCYDILDAWAKGTSLLEINWEQRNTAQFGEIVAPRSTYWVHPKNYAWDAEGNLGLVLPGAQGTERPTSPWYNTATRIADTGDLAELVPDKFIVAIRRARTGHPLGGALLRPLAWWWCAANFSADWLLNFAQVFGMPIRWANYDPQASQETIDAINSMLEDMGSSAWGSFPAGTTIELKEAMKGGGELPQAHVLDRADMQCDLLILGQTLTTSVSKDGGSRALGDVHNEVRMGIIRAAAGFLAESFNTQVIPSIVRLNYGAPSPDGASMPEMCPAFEPNEVDDWETAKASAEVIQVAVQAGVPVPVSYALEKLNIPEAEEGEPLLAAPVSGNFNNQTPNSNREEDAGMQARLHAHAHGRYQANDKLVERMLEDLTGVQARWLGGVKPFFRSLIAKAKDESLTDAEFLAVLERAQREIPELFAKLNPGALADALERATGTAVVNGAIRGYLSRQAASRQRKLQASNSKIQSYPDGATGGAA